VVILAGASVFLILKDLRGFTMSLDQDVHALSSQRKLNSFLVSAAGGVVTGGVVAVVNHSHGNEEMLAAGARQFLYTLTLGGVGVWMSRRFNHRPVGRVQRTLEATLYPSTFTFMVNWAYHTFLGTPEAFYSGLATFSMAMATFLPYAIYSQYHQGSRI